MLNGVERLSAVAKGLRADRIPVFCNLLDQGAKELGVSLKEFYSDGAKVAEAQLLMRRKYGYDNVWSLFYVGKEAELLGCRRIIFSADGPPNVGEMVIKKYSDIESLEIPSDILSHPAFEEPRKALKMLRAEAGGKYPICSYITSSMTLPSILMGMDKWMEFLFAGPPELRSLLLEKCSEFFRREIRAYRDAGADIFVYSNPFGSTDFVTDRVFEDISLEWMEKDLKAFGTDGVVYYCGGARMNRVIDRVIRRTGISAFYLSPLDDIAEAKNIIAGRAICAGVINDIRLIDWTEDEIRAEVRRMLEAGMPGGGFFFGTLVMPLAIPEKNIRTMLEAAYEYGTIR